MNFDGTTYNSELDGDRLKKQFFAVKRLMEDGKWRTLTEISKHVPGSLPGISARLRDLRKEKFGAHEVQKRRRGEGSAGLYEYRLVIKPKQLEFDLGT